MKDLRIAAVILNSRAGETEKNLERMKRWIYAAHEKKASLICFPELSVTGYHPHPEIKNLAETVPGPSSDYLLDLAKKNDVTILAGIAETNQNQIFASHFSISPDGISGIYRKLHVAPPEKGVFTPGNTLPLFEAKGLIFGVQLCYDAHFPELATRMALAGANAIFIPHASPGGTPKEKMASWMRHLPARGFDNSLFIIACNPCGENGRGLLFPGVGLVIGPSGEVINSYTGENEYMMIADLKAEDLDRVRSHEMRYFLPHRRPDIYSLMAS